MIVDDQEQPGPGRAVPLRIRDPRADQDTGDPPLVPAARPRTGRMPSAPRRGPPGAGRRGAAGRGRSARRRPPRAGGTGSRRSARPSGRAAPAAARRPRRTAPDARGPRRCRPAATASVPPRRRCATLLSTGRWSPGSSGAMTRPDGHASARRSAVRARRAPGQSAGRWLPRRSPPTGAAPPLPDPCDPCRSPFLPAINGTGGMKRRLPTIRKGEIVLAAIRLPPLTAQANRHTPRSAHPGRPHAPSNAAATASSANRPASAAGRITSPPRSTASAANATPSSPARSPNRRTHPRAVVCGTPARAAAGRTPHRPPATSPTTCPTASAASSRPASTNAGSSA
jgi:hypothetical protein